MKESNPSMKSAIERERTKMRERQRRSITTNIFHGLRKHGGYRLSPRADINEVLRHLAHEAGWIVDADGTTYRNPTVSNGNNACHLCGGAGGCSTTASPRRDSSVNILASGGGSPSITASGAVATNDALLAVYMCGSAAALRNGGGGTSDAAAYGEGQQQLCFLREAGVSNQNTPPGSP